MSQIDFQEQFLAIIDTYVAPMQEKVFPGYYHRVFLLFIFKKMFKPINSEMMFVVRYKAENQNSLRPHNDASTYSIDVALNKRNVDYEGGGVRFVRHNCTVLHDQVGQNQKIFRRVKLFKFRLELIIPRPVNASP